MRRFIMATVGILAASTASAGAIRYELDPQDSLLYLTVFKDTSVIASGMSHDHAVRAAAWSGSASIDPADLSSCDVRVSVPVSALVVDEPWMRQLAGLEGTLPDGMKDSVRKNMLSEAQLNIEEHPSMTFRSSGCTATRITGDLTIRGVTRRVEVPATLSASGEGLSLTGELTIRATEFGFAPFSAMMGAMKNRDDMRLRVTLIGAADAAADAE